MLVLKCSNTENVISDKMIKKMKQPTLRTTIMILLVVSWNAFGMGDAADDTKDPFFDRSCLGGDALFEKDDRPGLRLLLSDYSGSCQYEAAEALLRGLADYGTTADCALRGMCENRYFDELKVFSWSLRLDQMELLRSNYADFRCTPPDFVDTEKLFKLAIARYVTAHKTAKSCRMAVSNSSIISSLLFVMERGGYEGLCHDSTGLSEAIGGLNRLVEKGVRVRLERGLQNWSKGLVQ